MPKLNDTKQPSRVIFFETEFSTLKKRFPNGRTTAKRSWSAPLRNWEVEYDGLTMAEFLSILAFFEARSGGYDVFQFDDPHTGTTYNVRFADDRLARVPIRPNIRVYKCRFVLEEAR